MNQEPRIPDPETSKRLLNNLRRTHLEMKEFNLELEEIIAKIDQELCLQRLSRVRIRLSSLNNNTSG